VSRGSQIPEYVLEGCLAVFKSRNSPSCLYSTHLQQRPYFRQVAGSPIPMRVLDGRLTAGWQAEMGKEVSTMVSADHAPLLRAVLIHEAERSIFIITAHHSISDDGVSMTTAPCDLVRALSGEQLERRSVLPSSEDLLDVVSTRSTVQDQTQHAGSKGDDRTSFAHSYVEPFYTFLALPCASLLVLPFCSPARGPILPGRTWSSSSLRRIVARRGHLKCRLRHYLSQVFCNYLS
jgi:hypothetical protein